ncbi:hypothetical protein J5F27_08310 [Schleiferilactobacillus harbinensis]|uniref:Uncharacterized protein n=1 Tax=Schleiferilactobacillus harbinensis TaxID=304207 RepID=A0A510TWZ8_9LACO|nr:hypothetical protein [Schleiferilactobacillus harbinensis]MBO3091925.1 hypothetical protein [Schleiferilactobacillus harbinensis]QFR22315.1 hypothetical protein D1010_01995 [Schleiferilactobacillus harbinensis]GEK05431.1 hypothetical protein LHA01_06700 [Schleiferilactobacillus harbinensis]
MTKTQFYPVWRIALGVLVLASVIALLLWGSSPYRWLISVALIFALNMVNLLGNFWRAKRPLFQRIDYWRMVAGDCLQALLWVWILMQNRRNPYLALSIGVVIGSLVIVLVGDVYLRRYLTRA